MRLNKSHLTHGGDFCLGSVGLAIHGTTKSSLLTASAADYVIDGIIYEIAADAELQFDTTHTALGNGQVCVIVFGVNSSGTLSQYQSTIRNTADIASGLYTLEWPDIPDGIAPYAAVKVQTSSSATFTFDTTDLDAAGITDTYYNLSGIPVARPA